VTGPSPSREIYEKPPVVEAVIDIKCVNKASLTIRDLAAFASEFAPQFAQEGQSLEIEERYEPDGARKTTTERISGLVLRSSADNLRVIQPKLTGMSYSRLAPYERWESFRDEAKQAWLRYAHLAQPDTVTRIGVRYVNVLRIGSPAIHELAPFLQMHPVTPWSLSAPPDGFNLQVRRRGITDGVRLIINQATVLTVGTPTAGILLDLDAFLDGTFTTEEDPLWNQVEMLHAEVEEAFEAAITDHTRELFR